MKIIPSARSGTF